MRPHTERHLGVPTPVPSSAATLADGAPDEGGTGFERPSITSHTVITRRAAIGGGLAGLAGLGGLLLFPGQLMAKEAVLGDSFVLLLKGLYQPVVHGPDLGLSAVDLSDGSFSTVPIYAVSGIPGPTQRLSPSPTPGPSQSPGPIRNVNTAIGAFYVSFSGGDVCAYDLPGGSIAMRFTNVDDVVARNEPDGEGGSNVDATAELTILEATGIYRSYVGGHNQMWDRIHLLSPGDGTGGADEYCFCFISQPMTA